MTTPLRIGFVAPMLGGNPGFVLSQAEIQANLFTQAGFEVFRTSTIPSPIWRLADTIRSIISWRNEVDLLIHSVFSGRGFVNTDIVSQLCKIFHIPIIFSLHGGSLPAFARQHENWVKRTFQRADVFVSPSNYLAHFFSDWGYLVHVIPNLLTLSDYPHRLRSQIQPNLIWMRSFHSIYHPEMAIRVLQQLQYRFPDVKMTMAGSDKGLLPKLKIMAIECGLGTKIEFAGFLDLPGKQKQFARHDIYLNTNRVDNMPVSVMEAAAFGLPIVATRVGGIPYLLEHEQTGLLVEDGNAAEMAAAVTRLLTNPELVQHLSRNGRILAEKCSKENVLHEWDKLIRQVLRDD